VTSGLKLMLFGFFKKLVVADRIDIYVTSVYNNPEGFQGWPVILASGLFYFQVYCDFSGYTDIAIGSARTLGFKLMNNFDRPYLARSLKEFWTKWHISLISWFRDYLYIPLGGSKVKRLRLYFNIFIVFVISGLWHGANWNFVLWGTFLGMAQVLEKILTPVSIFLKKKFSVFKIKFVFGVAGLIATFSIIALSTLFFRSTDFAEFQEVLSNMFCFDTDCKFVLLKNPDFILSVIFVIIMLAIEILHARYSLTGILSKKPLAVRYAAYIVFVFIILLFGCFAKNDFIYFQF
jgi:D-alanyl-lipoteichoic acid acyltransferase DltB (MBOAT superfamily)